VVTPAARRTAVTHAREAHGISERRACLILGADRSAVRYRHRRSDDVATRQRLRELAAERRRFGWRRLKLLLEREGTRMNRCIPKSGSRFAVVVGASARWAHVHR
jgi:putative transposase